MQEIIDYVLKNVISIALGGGTINYIIAGVVLVLGVAGIILFKKSARETEIDNAVNNGQDQAQQAEQRLDDTNQAGDDFLNGGLK